MLATLTLSRSSLASSLNCYKRSFSRWFFSITYAKSPIDNAAALFTMLVSSCTSSLNLILNPSLALGALPYSYTISLTALTLLRNDSLLASLITIGMTSVYISTSDKC